ncbi:PhzF family phenazine biosynthesis isomerase [Flavobacteriaceae bacterium R38]|nr:PhzF family phenazine biosynthesis isomerase [Flavobacteriaceae bacterium R38]
MTVPIYKIDAFTDTIFKGNNAAVCLLKRWLDNDVLLKIAQENNLPETAFLVQNGKEFYIRWFTPEIEMDLCGHATLASAHVIFNHLQYEKESIVFKSASGSLKALKKNDIIYLDFPSREPEKTDLPDVIVNGLEKLPKEVYKSRDYVLVYENEADIKGFKPKQKVWDQINLDPGGIIITAPGDKVDFVSRFFTPQASIFEDPVTGSAHCSLIPFWAKRLGKKELTAKQLSNRGGSLDCTFNENRVLIGGQSITYLKGEIYV